jgi:hypothetical protein
LRGGRSRRLGIRGTDGRKIEMPTFYRSHEAALAQPMLPQSEQVCVGLSLTTGLRPSTTTAPDSWSMRKARDARPGTGF